jgi:hypothetical protein
MSDSLENCMWNFNLISECCTWYLIAGVEGWRDKCVPSGTPHLLRIKADFVPVLISDLGVVQIIPDFEDPDWHNCRVSSWSRGLFRCWVRSGMPVSRRAGLPPSRSWQLSARTIWVSERKVKSIGTGTYDGTGTELGLCHFTGTHLFLDD